MGLFGNPRKNKDKWAKFVVTNAQPGMSFDEKFLDAAKEFGLYCFTDVVQLQQACTWMEYWIIQNNNKFKSMLMFVDI